LKLVEAPTNSFYGHENTRCEKKATKKGSQKTLDGEDMLIDERRHHILGLLQRDGRGLVAELSRQLGISQITIRKDLDHLEGKGLVQRTHGGALPVPTGALFVPSLQEKQKQHSHEKQRIAAAAARLAQEGQCVMLDSGTTTTAIAQALRRFSQLTVITNAVILQPNLPEPTSRRSSPEARCERTPSRWWARWQRTYPKRCMRTYFFSG
jgi:predicted transcriptional regulator